ncbi:hypothetical protein IWQ60_012286 [Tieghemiomyces parasiticus]|uniref:Uncharacterized protein n=1 Tax=Tieghemiomyces parasiticus TaxID=78921 RepID=A0A9W7ZLN9_9FUNG|nr:hypothetical protein IWQ60_012286 [Tieghemiomyces parasiticus]
MKFPTALIALTLVLAVTQAVPVPQGESGFFGQATTIAKTGPAVQPKPDPQPAPAPNAKGVAEKVTVNSSSTAGNHATKNKPKA